MEFNRLLELVADIPIFESSLLLAGEVAPENLRLQLTRWTQSGKLYQLRRGLYALAPPHQKVKPHPFLLANLIQRASYVSLQSALAFHGMIPEAVQRTTSVTTARPGYWNTPLGVFLYRHIQADLLHGYRMVDLETAPSQQALVATAEKALLDLVYFHPGGESPRYLMEMRLQNLDQLDLDELNRQAELFHSPKMQRGVRVITALVKNEAEEFETL